MRYCTKCGKELSEGAAFCGSCGAPGGEKAEQRETPYLNAPRPPKKTNGTKWLLGVIITVAVCTMGGLLGRTLVPSLKSAKDDKPVSTVELLEETVDTSPIPTVKNDLSSVKEDTENTPITGAESDGTYENRLFGFGCKLSGWAFSSEEELYSDSAFYKDYMGDVLDEKFQEDVKNSDGCIVMQATDVEHADADGACNVNLTVGKMDSQMKLAAGNEAMLLKSLETQMKEMYQDMDYEVEWVRCEKNTLGGQSKYSLNAQMVMFGVPVYMEQFFFLAENNYGVMTITAGSQEKAAAVRDLFYLLD